MIPHKIIVCLLQKMSKEDPPVRRRRTPANREKKRIIDLEPPGLGPWYAFMMVNVDEEEDSKKQTEIRLDTSPECINAIKNASDQGDWAIVMRMGPFYDLNFAGTVFAEWSDGTRGPGPRISQGICLWWEKYRDKGTRRDSALYSHPYMLLTLRVACFRC